MSQRNSECLPATKAEAKELGLKHYMTGKPCARGHISKRYVSTGQCHKCQYENRIKWKTENPDKEAESRLNSVRLWLSNNKDRKRELSRLYNSDPETSKANVERARAWRLANKERHANNQNAADHRRRARITNADGNHTAEDTEAILKRQKFKCAECGVSVKKKEDRHVDHIIPLSKGGTNWPRNLQILCCDCNLHKAAKDPLEFAQQRGRLV